MQSNACLIIQLMSVYAIWTQQLFYPGGLLAAICELAGGMYLDDNMLISHLENINWGLPKQQKVSCLIHQYIGWFVDSIRFLDFEYINQSQGSLILIVNFARLWNRLAAFAGVTSGAFGGFLGTLRWSGLSWFLPKFNMVQLLENWWKLIVYCLTLSAVVI